MLLSTEISEQKAEIAYYVVVKVCNALFIFIVKNNFDKKKLGALFSLSPSLLHWDREHKNYLKVLTNKDVNTNYLWFNQPDVYRDGIHQGNIKRN